MPQMARKPFIGSTMVQLWVFRQEPRKSRFRRPDRAAPPRGRSFLIFWAYPMKAVPLFLGASCDSFRRSLPAHPLPPLRRRPLPKLAFSSSPMRPTAMASTSASPRATNAVPTRPVPIANHAILRRPRPIAALILMRSPGRCRNQALIARAAAAMNMSPSPASAERRNSRAFGATPVPRKRRDAAERSGYWRRLQLAGCGRTP
jgi:hypothetical protein